jgi:hypothetical protein
MKHPPLASEAPGSGSAWLIVNVSPAILMLPVRAIDPVLGSTENERIAFPLPLFALVMEIQVSWLAANQLQSPDVVMVSCPAPPLAVKS